MPKMKEDPEVAAREGLLRAVRIALADRDMNYKELGEAMGLEKSAVSRMVASPDDIKIRRLRSVIRILQLDPEAVLRFLGYSSKQIQCYKKG